MSTLIILLDLSLHHRTPQSVSQYCSKQHFLHIFASVVNNGAVATVAFRLSFLLQWPTIAKMSMGNLALCADVKRLHANDTNNCV